LEGGHPLPASLPVLRDRVVYHERLVAHLNFHSQPQVNPDKQPADDSDSDSDHESEVFAAHKVDGSSIGFEEMTLDILMVRQVACLILKDSAELEFDVGRTIACTFYW
jgi:hypothetical protein